MRFKMTKNNILISVYVLVIFIGMMRTYFKEGEETFSLPVNCKTIVVDAGHERCNYGIKC